MNLRVVLLSEPNLVWHVSKVASIMKSVNLHLWSPLEYFAAAVYRAMTSAQVNPSLVFYGTKTQGVSHEC